MTVTEKEARDDILAEFAMEDPLTHNTLRTYITRHPDLAHDLLELFNELTLSDLEIAEERYRPTIPMTATEAREPIEILAATLADIDGVGDAFKAERDENAVETATYYGYMVQAREIVRLVRPCGLTIIQTEVLEDAVCQLEHLYSTVKQGHGGGAVEWSTPAIVANLKAALEGE